MVSYTDTFLVDDFCRGDVKLTEVSVSDKLEEFRAAKEVAY